MSMETTYFYSGTTLVSMDVFGEVLNFTYDAEGKPFSMSYDGGLYYYIINLQGDVVGLYDESGELVVAYTYDAWGDPYASGTMANTVGFMNPFRFKCYVYDEDMFLYYLQSRYYDPQTGRFISADAYLVAGDHINSTNMFAYCLNNPVMYWDPRGTSETNVMSSIYQELQNFISTFIANVPIADPSTIAALTAVATVVFFALYVQTHYDSKTLEDLEFIEACSSSPAPLPPGKGGKGTPTNGSKTIYKSGTDKPPLRMDVEVPNNGEGNIHIQIQGDANKYYYNVKDMKFHINKVDGPLAPQKIQDLLLRRKIIRKIAYGLRMLGY